ncbi:hypothetical protein C8E83_3541 [Frondihabitans australicus]|uniref:Uncharacterized protein n=2 Tax=Frondihabitans australicus TaxID=386892 RepID=A0A495IKR1_9MICO|nr:hypothetical protein C8E83_3541 [Frondihabitans australicus]
MSMVALCGELVQKLGDVAVDVAEGFEADSGTVSAALELHPSFTDTNHTRSSMIRAIIAREFSRAAIRAGMYERDGSGGAREIFELNGDEYALIRLRGAKHVNGELRVIANKGSSFGGIADDELVRLMPYVFAWFVDDTHRLRFLVAEVRGRTDTKVQYFEFGWTHYFDVPTVGGGFAFTPDDGDELDGWDVDESEQSGKQG